MFLLVIFFFAGSAWFFYDGFIGYPKLAERYAVFDELVQDMKDSGQARTSDDESVRLAWAEKARELGWKVEKPKNKTEKDFLEQRFYGAGLALLGMGILIWIVISSSQTILFDGRIITGPTGKNVDISRITELDKKKWDKKGIAYAIYKEDGKENKFTLDDYKFGGTDEIIREIEKNLARTGSAEASEDTAEQS